MIGKTLQDILDEKGTNANELSKMIGVSCQTIYSIIKRDNMKIDFEVLLKICKALNVSVERFYSDYCDYSEAAYLLSPHEKELVSAYREQPDMQKSVDKLLGIEPEEKLYIIEKAARNGDNSPLVVTDSKLKELENLPEVPLEDG